MHGVAGSNDRGSRQPTLIDRHLISRDRLAHAHAVWCGTNLQIERFFAMTDPINLHIPHKLGLENARARLESGLGQIASMVPGGSMKSHRWQDNTLHFELEVLGQSVRAELEVFETSVHAVIALPPVVALFASKISSKVSEVGIKLLK